MREEEKNAHTPTIQQLRITSLLPRIVSVREQSMNVEGDEIVRGDQAKSTTPTTPWDAIHQSKEKEKEKQKRNNNHRKLEKEQTKACNVTA